MAEQNIKKARYRIKNDAGVYETIYFETSMDQVEGLDSKMGEVEGLINDRYTKGQSDEMFRAVETEITEVENAVEGLVTRVTKNEKDIVSLNESLTNEVNRAQGVEADLQAQINGLDASIEAINHPESGILKQSKDYTDSKIKDLGDIVDGIEGSLGSSNAELTGKIEALEGVVSSNKAEVDGAISSLEGRLTGLTTRVDVAETAIEDLRGADARLESEIQSVKDAIGSKNSNTLVFSTMDEFVEAAAGLTPKIGDLVFVIDIKKSFIYKGADAAKVLDIANVPAGFVVFDEITTEIDLQSYAKRSEVEGHVATLEGKITSEQERAMAAEKALADSIEAVNGVVGTHGERLTVLEGAVKTQGEAIENLTQDTYTKAEVDKIVDDAVTAQMSYCGKVEPTGKKVGHVFIELI